MSSPQSLLSSGADISQLRLSPSSGGEHGLGIHDIITSNRFDPATEKSAPIYPSEPSLAERVFQALADAKIWTSRVAMRMSLTDRDRYFRQLDLLHDCDEWFGEDEPMKIASYQGFVRFMLKVGGNSKPSLALSPDGALLAIWETNGNRLTMEFSTDNVIEWVVSYNFDGQVYRTAGQSPTEITLKNLMPYNPDGWFIVD